MTKGTCVASGHQLVVTVVTNQCLSQRKGLYRKRLQYYFWIERCFLLEGRIFTLFVLSCHECTFDSACQKRGKRQLTCERVCSYYGKRMLKAILREQMFPWKTYGTTYPQVVLFTDVCVLPYCQSSSSWASQKHTQVKQLYLLSLFKFSSVCFLLSLLHAQINHAIIHFAKRFYISI